MKKLATLLLCTAASVACISADPTFTSDATHSVGKVSPKLYGLMTEEINHSYDGGLYAELIRNRAFLDDAKSPAHWSLVNENGAKATIALDTTNSFNDALSASLCVTVTKASKNESAGAANSGYWGIPVQPNTQYRASLIARAEPGFTGPLALSLV